MSTIISGAQKPHVGVASWLWKPPFPLLHNGDESLPQEAVVNTKRRKPEDCGLPEDCDGDLGSYKGVDGKARVGVRGPMWDSPSWF